MSKNFKSAHPFMDHPGDITIPKDKRAAVNEIYKW